jgi:hypothetical protein
MKTQDYVAGEKVGRSAAATKPGMVKGDKREGNRTTKS